MQPHPTHHQATSVIDTRTHAVREALTALLTGLTPDPFDDLLCRDDAYTVVLGLLAHLEANGHRRTTVGELHTWSRVTPGGQALGGHDRLLALLQQAADHGHIRLDHGLAHIGDAPRGPGLGAGRGHLWARYTNRSGAVVELAGATPWPCDQAWPTGTPTGDDPLAWWWCTGCRDGHRWDGQPLGVARERATGHAATCTALPALPDSR
ncbi:hypothetical protein ACFVVA_41835 [Kitasatospora sp. NPDC058048]|uniref:hypothetical protein n=1 Tax=Kitasatospora sp. NPDC058048 TaxID=3346313 RepID=UPI0036DAE088